MQGPRAVAVVRRATRVLVIRRHVTGRRPTDYAVLPGGGVEPGETFEEAVVRELAEEAGMSARVDRLLFTGTHGAREARYFLMADVTGEPVLGGPERDDHGPDNSFELRWATAAELEAWGLYPTEVLPRLADLLSR